MPIGHPSEELHPFLKSYEAFLQGYTHTISFGLALGTYYDITTCSDVDPEVKVSRKVLLEAVNAEYPALIKKLNPFYISLLLKDLSSVDSEMSLAEFRNAILKCARSKNVHMSIDLAILQWLADAIRLNPDVKLDSSWFPFLCNIINHRIICNLFSNDIIAVLFHVQRLIDSKILTRQQISPLLSVLGNIPGDGLIAHIIGNLNQ